MFYLPEKADSPCVGEVEHFNYLELCFIPLYCSAFVLFPGVKSNIKGTSLEFTEITSLFLKMWVLQIRKLKIEPERPKFVSGFSLRYLI